MDKIAVFTNGMINEYLRLVIEGIREEASKEGTDVFVFVSYAYFTEVEKQNNYQLKLFDLPNPKEFDGVIMLTNTFNIPEEQDKVISRFAREGVPIISLETKVDGLPYIGSENYRGMFDLTNHLINEHGAKKIVYFAGIEKNQEDAIRHQAVVDALREHKMNLAGRLQGDFGYYTAKTEIDKWIEEGKSIPDAFVCANDYTALGVTASLIDHKIRVPEDCIVTGFDWCKEGRVSFPMIATISRGWDIIGNKAFLQLKKIVETSEYEDETILPSVFVPSESCGCAPKEEDFDFRVSSCRNAYADLVYMSMITYLFKDIKNSISDMTDIAEFGKRTNVCFDRQGFLGDDFWICTEHAYFELSDIVYPERVKSYSNTMDVIYSREQGKYSPLFSFDTKELVPGYRKEEGKSNTYVFAALNNKDFLVGYVCLKNNLQMLYNQALNEWIVNMNDVFLQIRRFIFAKKNSKRIEEIYMCDTLTGVYNRNGCLKLFEQFMKDLKKQGKKSQLMFFDVCKMKEINSELGTLYGDLALKASAQAIRKSIPSGWLVSRYGGDEFVVIGEKDDSMTCSDLTEKIKNDLYTYIENLKLHFPLSMGIGAIEILPDDQRELDELIALADETSKESKINS